NVSAQGRDDAFVIDGETPRALTVWCLPPSDDGKPTSKTAYIQRMAPGCASEIVRLLNLGQRGEAGFEGSRGRRSLSPADLAVLVNNR
ncbi:hypothetical protein, partial [Caballeronia sp. INML3]